MNWLDLLAVQGTPKNLLQHHSSKASILQHSAFFRVQLSYPYMTTGKTIALTRQTFVCKVMSLLFNMLSRLVIAFLPRSKHLLISWLQLPSAVNLEPPKIKSVTVSIVSPSIYHEVTGPNAMIFIFWMLSFKPNFSLSSSCFIKRLFSSSLLSATSMLSAYLGLLMFLPAILIPAFASSSLTFHMMYSEYKLNKQGDNLQPWHTPFLIWNQSDVPCPILTVVFFWPAYRFIRRKFRWSGIPISSRIFHSLLWSTQSIGIANKAKVDVFLELSCFFNDPADVGNLISGSSAFSKSSLNICKFMVFALEATTWGPTWFFRLLDLPYGILSQECTANRCI